MYTTTTLKVFSNFFLLILAFVSTYVCVSAQTCSDATTFKCWFTDDLNAYESSNWYRGQWYSGSPFGSYIYPGNVQFESGKLKLQVTERSETFNQEVIPYAGGQLQTLAFHGYGYYEVLAKPAGVSG